MDFEVAQQDACHAHALSRPLGIGAVCFGIVHAWVAIFTIKKIQVIAHRNSRRIAHTTGESFGCVVWFEDHARLFVLPEKSFIFPAPAAVGRFHNADTAHGGRCDAALVPIDVTFARNGIVRQCFRVVFVVVNGVKGPTGGVACALVHGFEPYGAVQTGCAIGGVFGHPWFGIS